MTSKTLAIALAGVAVVLAGVAVIVVATRSRDIVQVPAAVETVSVAADDVMALETGAQFTPQGAHVDDPALAARLHLHAGDVIVALSGRRMHDGFDVHRVITLDGAEVIAELSRDGQAVLERWKVNGKARSPAPPSGSAAATAVIPPVPPPAPPPPDPLLDTIVRDDDTHAHLPRATVEALLADPDKLMRDARIVPATYNGAPAGFRIFGVRPSSIAKRLGLQNGDTIYAINGLQLSSADLAIVAYPQLRHAVHLDVSIDRHGTPMTISIQIN
jgi:S1-C subfamily serine protease